MKVRTVDEIEDEIRDLEDEISELEERIAQLDAERDELLAMPPVERPWVFHESLYVPLDRPVSP